jgi:hypothetical protein
MPLLPFFPSGFFSSPGSLFWMPSFWSAVGDVTLTNLLQYPSMELETNQTQFFRAVQP